MKLKLNASTELGKANSQPGKEFVAQFDDSTVVVYQAFNDKIADYALANQAFGGSFSFNRTSWIKPSFLWMMHRSGWATKEDQKRVLAIYLEREFFDGLLREGVQTKYHGNPTGRLEWKEKLSASEVLIQNDPDRDVCGHRIERPSIQIGLRGNKLREYAQKQISELEDITSYVAQQRALVEQKRRAEIVTPVELPYQLLK